MNLEINDSIPPAPEMVGGLKKAPQAKQSKLGSFVVGVLSHSAPLGVVVGTVMGLARRLTDNRAVASWTSQEICKAGLSQPWLNAVYQGMQNYVCTPVKYTLPLLPLAMVGLAAFRGAENQGGGWRRMAYVASLVGLVAASSVVAPLLGLTSANPSVELMTQMVLGVAVGQTASAASRFGMSTVACLTTLGAMGLAAANAIFFSGSVFACHTALETGEGLKWGAAVVVGAYVVIRVLSAGVSLCSGMTRRGAATGLVSHNSGPESINEEVKRSSDSPAPVVPPRNLPPPPPPVVIHKPVASGGGHLGGIVGVKLRSTGRKVTGESGEVPDVKRATLSEEEREAIRKGSDKKKLGVGESFIINSPLFRKRLERKEEGACKVVSGKKTDIPITNSKTGYVPKILTKEELEAEKLRQKNLSDQVQMALDKRRNNNNNNGIQT